MRRRGDDVVVSAFDLVGRPECEHPTSLQIMAEFGLRSPSLRAADRFVDAAVGALFA